MSHKCPRFVCLLTTRHVLLLLISVSLQKTLLATERQVKDLQQLHTDAHSFGSSNSCTTQDESSTLATGVTTTNDENNCCDESVQRRLVVTIDQLRHDNQVLQQELTLVISQRSKLAANLRQRKSLLIAAAASRAEQALQHQQLVSVRSGLQQVGAVRDDLKQKLRVKQEILVATRSDRDQCERCLKKMEKERGMEVQLLALYRELANHTGYYKWGKRIRMLEQELAASKLLDAVAAVS
jgi:hypothetical protein